jgi:hypothetical protein
MHVYAEIKTFGNCFRFQIRLHVGLVLTLGTYFRFRIRSV